jgi:hypothetical protein
MGETMKRPTRLQFTWKYYLLAALIISGAVAVTRPAGADTYHLVNFSGGMFGGPNVQPPFLGNGFEPGGPVTGNFLIDDQLVPASGSGFVNVFFSTFPAIGIIPAGTVFTIKLGTTPLTFNLADAMYGSGAIQYNNGQFNGFFFQKDFTFLGNQYRLDIQGGTWNIQQLVNGMPTFQNLVSGYINIGNNNLTNLRRFIPGGSISARLFLLLLQ